MILTIMFRGMATMNPGAGNIDFEAAHSVGEILVSLMAIESNRFHQIIKVCLERKMKRL